MVPPGDHRRQPHRRPGVARHAGPGHHRLLQRTDVQGAGTTVGNRRAALEHLVGSGEDLGAGQHHRLVQRLDELEEELVHGHRPGQPGAERLDHVVGDGVGAVHQLLGEPLYPLVEDRGAERHHGGRQDGQAEYLAVPGPGFVTEAQDDQQVDGQHHGRQPGDGQQPDQDAVRRGQQAGKEAAATPTGTSTVPPAAMAQGWTGHLHQQASPTTTRPSSMAATAPAANTAGAGGPCQEPSGSGGRRRPGPSHGHRPAHHRGRVAHPARAEPGPQAEGHRRPA